MRWIGLIVILAALGGCAQYNLVTTERHNLGGFSVEPQIEWSSIDQGKITIWTVNGSGLEAIYFADGIADGDPFFDRRFGESEKELPLFHSPMTANEAMEFVVDTLITSGAGEVYAVELRPKKFGAHAGFRFDLEYLGATGLEGSGMAFGAIIEDKLYLMLYLAAAEHYFTTYGGHVERMFDSLKTP